MIAVIIAFRECNKTHWRVGAVLTGQEGNEIVYRRRVVLPFSESSRPMETPRLSDTSVAAVDLRHRNIILCEDVRP